jgi:hypothetical protein
MREPPPSLIDFSICECKLILISQDREHGTEGLQLSLAVRPGQHGSFQPISPIRWMRLPLPISSRSSSLVYRCGWRGFDLYPTINNNSTVSVIRFLFPNDVGSNLSIVGGIFQIGIESNDAITAADGLALAPVPGL